MPCGTALVQNRNSSQGSTAKAVYLVKVEGVLRYEPISCEEYHQPGCSGPRRRRKDLSGGSMLYLAGASDRRGKIGDGNTVCDYDPEEIRRKSSVSAAVAPFEWKNHKINLLDAPGLFDFESGLCEAVRAADTVLIAVSGKSGVAVGTEKAFAAAEKRGLAKNYFRKRPVR